MLGHARNRELRWTGAISRADELTTRARDCVTRWSESRRVRRRYRLTQGGRSAILADMCAREERTLRNGDVSEQSPGGSVRSGRAVPGAPR